MSLPPAARFSVDDFERFCVGLRTETGEPLRLYPEQKTMLGDYFDGVRETVILIPKKNGKSTVVSALALFHIVTTEDALCVLAAASRKQVEDIILRQCKMFIRRNEWLSSRMRVVNREIRWLGDESKVVVLASEVDTADGVIPTLAIVDELHRHKDGELYGVFRDGLGPRNGQIITISTAGDDTESPLGSLRERLYAHRMQRAGAHRYVRTPEVALHEWALEDSDDRADMALVKMANPAPWHTEAKLRERFESSTTTPWQWARFACGVWLQGEDTVISPVEWAACAVDEFPAPEGTVRIGADLATVEDTTGLVVHWLDADGVAWVPECRVLEPPKREGESLKKAEIVGAISELADRWGATEVVIDPERGGWIFGEDIEEQLDLEVTAHSQKPAVMAEAAERLYTAVREEKLRHLSDSVFTRHVLNAHSKTTDDGRWRFVKENKQSRKVIDACIALAMVHNIAIEEAERPADIFARVYG